MLVNHLRKNINTGKKYKRRAKKKNTGNINIRAYYKIFQHAKIFTQSERKKRNIQILKKKRIQYFRNVSEYIKTYFEKNKLFQCFNNQVEQ
jgi:hypothetical protein